MEAQDSPQVIRNFILRRLDGTSIELISCDSEDVQDHCGQSAVAFENLSYVDVGTETNKLNSEANLKQEVAEVPVIRNAEHNSVVPQSSASTVINGNTTPHEVPVLSKPKTNLIDVMVYSCFKCRDKFRSLTLFRMHLKGHVIEKNFSCTRCLTDFKNENNLKIHYITNHNSIMDFCPICQIRFQRKASLKSHVLVHQVEELFMCEECQGEFQNDDELLKHMESHAVTKLMKSFSDSLVCPYCKLEFETVADYGQHITKHVAVKRIVLKGKKLRKKKTKPNGQIKRYKCKYCRKLFPKNGLLLRHERIHTGEKPFKCHSCEKCFTQKGTLQIHLDKHKGVKPYACTLCSAKFSQKGNLRAHVQSTHTIPKNGCEAFRCMQCPCIFKTIASLNCHMTRMHIIHDEPGEDSEDIIDKVMSSLKELNSELGKSALKRDEPKPAPPVPASNKGTSLVRLAENHVNGSVRRYLVRQKMIGDIRWYFCNFCSSQFKKPSDLIKHIRSHTLEKPFTCSICNQSFSLKTTLANHYRTHERSECECVYCDTTFQNMRYYRAHMWEHEKDKAPQYACVLCEKLFLTLAEGKEHRALHEGDIQSTRNIIEPVLRRPLYQTAYGALPLATPKRKAPYSHHCTICNARFTRHLSLQRHMLYHQNDRKFKCDLCPKAFVTNSRLQEHLKFHKNIRNYACKSCGKKFVTSSLLKRHSVIHSKARPYTCPYCDKNFRTILLARSHIRNIHRRNANELDKEKSARVAERKWEHGDELRKKVDTVNSNRGTPTKEPSAYVELPPVEQQQQNEPTPSKIEPKQDLDPDYQMVYLNDILEAKIDSSYPNDSYFFGDLQNSSMFLNVEPSKTEIVNRNEVIESTTVSLIDNQPTDLATEKHDPEVSFTVEAEGLSGIELMDGLPVTIIDTTEPNALTENLIESEIIPFDAQVICINCHQMFANYSVFESHACSDDCAAPTERNDLQLTVEESAANDQSEKVYATTGENVRINCMDKSVQIPDTGEPEISDFCEEQNPEVRSNPKLNLKRMKQFKYKKSLLADIEKLESSKEIKCKHCKFTSPSEESFRKHLLSHPDRSDRTCRFCFKDFQKPSDLKRHLRTHTGEKPFECDRCRKRFTLKSTLEAHVKTHQSTGQTKICCDVCNSNFTSKSSLKVHMLLHTGARPHACNFCEQTFRTSAIRKAHEKSIHLTKNGTSNKPKLGGSQLVKSVADQVAENVRKECDNSQQFQTVDEPLTAAIIVNPGQPDSVTLDPVFLLQDIQEPGIILASNAGDSSIPINLGDITLLDVSGLQLADIGQNLTPQSVNDEQPPKAKLPEQKQQKVQCDICHKMYASKDVLRKHKKALHGQNRKFPCIKCDKGYDQLDELNKHIAKLHAGCRPYACQYCANSFSEENSLKTHIKRIHQKSLLGQETANALLGLQCDLSSELNFV